MDAMQRDADTDMTMGAIHARITFPPRSSTAKINPFITGNNLNVYIGEMPRCCQFSVGMTLGLTSPEVTLRTPNMLSLMRQANTSWTKADFVTDLMALNFNESPNSDICILMAAYLVPGRFNIRLSCDDIPSTFGNMIFSSCLAEIMLPHSQIRSRNVLIDELHFTSNVTY